MNIEAYNKYLTHFLSAHSADHNWILGKKCFAKAYSYFGEDWRKTIALANDFIAIRKE